MAENFQFLNKNDLCYALKISAVAALWYLKSISLPTFYYSKLLENHKKHILLKLKT